MLLRDRRLSKGLTIKELSILSGVSQSQIRQLENRPETVLRMKGETALKLCIALECTIRELTDDYYAPSESSTKAQGE